MDVPSKESDRAAQCGRGGFVLKPPPAKKFLRLLAGSALTLFLDHQLKLPIPQQLRENRWVDTEDRASRAGARLLRGLVSAGL